MHEEVGSHGYLKFVLSATYFNNMLQKYRIISVFCFSCLQAAIWQRGDRKSFRHAKFISQAYPPSCIDAKHTGCFVFYEQPDLLSVLEQRCTGGWMGWRLSPIRCEASADCRNFKLIGWASAHGSKFMYRICLRPLAPWRFLSLS